MKNTHIYQISPGYSRVTVWSGAKMTCACVGVTTFEPKAERTREERHGDIATFLYGQFKIPGPCYRDTDANVFDLMGSTERVLTCVYCGQAYPSGTPAWGSQVLTDHIKVCVKHPMRALEADNTKLRQALTGLVGTDNPETLILVEQALNTLPASASEQDRTIMLNAVQLLRNTAPKT